MRAWRFLPWLMVRVAGFPVELLHSLRATETVALFARLDTVDGELAVWRTGRMLPFLRAEVIAAREAGDRARLRALAKARKAVEAGRPVTLECDVGPEWHRLLALRDTLLAEAREAYGRELAVCRATLRRIVARPDVLDALLVSSPAMRVAAERHVAGEPGPRTTVVRKLERRLASYVQRFCAKNETQSFFGPVNYGRLDATSRESLTLVRTGHPRARESFPAQWMAERVAAVIAADPEAPPLLTPRRGTWSRRVPPADQRLYDAADGTATVRELAQLLGEEWPTTWARVSRLARDGVLVVGPLIPPDRPDPLAWLVDWVTDTPLAHRWVPALESLRARVRSFAEAAPADRVAVLDAVAAEFTAVCGSAETTRSGGDMYADRALLFEECHGDIAEFVVGGSLHQVITERLAPILRLATRYGVLERRRDGRAAARVLARLGSTDMALPHYLSALSRQPAEAGGDDELDDFLATLHDLVERRSDGGVARLTGADLPDDGPSDPEEMVFTSLDLMIRAESLDALRAGRCQVIVGEVHPQPLLWVFPSAHFLDPADRAALGDALHSGLSAQPGAKVAAQYAHTRTNKIFPLDLPGQRVELRPRRSIVDSLPAVDIRVRARDDGVCCWTPAAGWLRFYPPLRRRHDRLDPVAPFAFPAVHLPTIGLGDRTPRVEVEGVVLQRARWRLTAGEFALPTGDDFTLFRNAWLRRRELGLPRQVYVRVPQEPKPVYIDFANFFLVELLAHLGRLSPTMTVSEALPDTDDAWLSGPDGRVTCELRLVVFGEHQ